MRLYLDTADPREWDRLLPTGMFHGITTNPKLFFLANRQYSTHDWANYFQTAKDLGAQELHVQVPNTDINSVEWIKGRHAIAKGLGLEMVAKVPLTAEGAGIAASLHKSGVKLLMTAGYHAKQLYIAAGIGAEYCAPYFGRMSDAGRDTDVHFRQMAAIEAQSNTKVMVASLRNPEQMLALSEMGLSHFTISPSVADAILHDDLTLAAVEEFEAAVT